MQHLAHCTAVIGQHPDSVVLFLLCTKISWRVAFLHTVCLLCASCRFYQSSIYSTLTRPLQAALAEAGCERDAMGEQMAAMLRTHEQAQREIAHLQAR